MMRSTPSARLAEAIADARAAAAVAALIGDFASVGTSMQRVLDMRKRLDDEKVSAEAAAANEWKDLAAQADVLAVERITRRLVDADALFSATGKKFWLNDAFRSAAQDYNSVLEAHARGEASLTQADAARIVLTAASEAMRIVGRLLDQREKKPKARSASRPFDQAD